VGERIEADGALRVQQRHHYARSLNLDVSR
jgi:hypothetical protein